MSEEIINKVAESGLITLDLEDYLPKNKIVELDIRDQLFQGLALKEKNFREFIKTQDWSVYKDQLVGVYCSNDAIIPTWAFMLLASVLQPYAEKIYFGKRENVIHQLLTEKILKLEVEKFKDQLIIIKGCAKENISMDVYMQLVQKLQPHVKSIMFGEPCSTVPVYKKPK